MATTMYCIKKDGVIVLKHESQQFLEDTKLVMPELADCKVTKMTKTEVNAYNKELEEKEAKRIEKLNMTKLDFYYTILKPNNITYQELEQIVATNDELKANWDLCKDVFRGNKFLAQYVIDRIPDMTEEKLTEIFEKVTAAKLAEQQNQLST